MSNISQNCIDLCGVLNLIMIAFSQEQLDKLAELSLDLAKGLFLGAFTAPIISPDSLILSLKSLLAALFFVYLSLKLIELKEVLK